MQLKYVRSPLACLACWGMTVLLAGINPLPALSQDADATTKSASLTMKIMAMERGLEQEFEDYFGQDLAEVTQTPDDIAQTLSRLGEQTQTKPAVLWVIPRVDHLHLVLITPGGKPIVRDLYEVPPAVLMETVQSFQQGIKRAMGRNRLVAAQQLHEWIIEPFESEYLQAEGIDTLLFCLGNGVRGLSVAALYDGQQFLLEKYSLTRIPAFNLIQTDYASVQQGQILAMGASEFQDQNPLPAVPMEVSRIMWELRSARRAGETWEGRSLLNQRFTLQNLSDLLSMQPFDIVHLATHAEFKPGVPNNSYIQLWDTKLGLDQTRDLAWNLPPIELLVLSACRTAMGDEEAEMGFAGIALQAGVKSALASLWYVDDMGTLALMSEFYRQLTIAPTKAEALRQAQLRMLRGEVRFEGDRLLLSRGEIPLPVELTEAIGDDLSHPFYWAGFTLISSPW
ncbi:MAG: CHAT domain-containing protein [Cyanothece sp. SIO1E1]|nr:CHAT domain-containing protein [Cyanothece sp. SIO1E1]